ncbi:MAG TPA: DinB family protein [Gemmatimonadaceae bacterium]
MSIADTLLPEFEQEMVITRRVLERVPDDNPNWKPHAKSFSIAHLAQLIAWLPGWIGQTLTTTELDLASGGGYSNEKTSTLLETFEENVRKSREAISAASDSDFDVPWSLKMKGNVLFTMPRGAVVRQHISHLSHHRGQMTVYLRMRDVPVPGTYGPSADETWGSR